MRYIREQIKREHISAVLQLPTNVQPMWSATHEPVISESQVQNWQIYILYQTDRKHTYTHCCLFIYTILHNTNQKDSLHVCGGQIFVDHGRLHVSGLSSTGYK